MGDDLLCLIIKAFLALSEQDRLVRNLMKAVLIYEGIEVSGSRGSMLYAKGGGRGLLGSLKNGWICWKSETCRCIPTMRRL